jgi:hypothetical protein
MRNAAKMFSFDPNPTTARKAWSSSTCLLYGWEDFSREVSSSRNICSYAILDVLVPSNFIFLMLQEVCTYWGYTVYFAFKKLLNPKNFFIRTYSSNYIYLKKP